MPDGQHAPARFLHPIPTGWVATTGDVGGPNYDEFTDDADVAAVLDRRPNSVVALDLPQHTQPARRAGLDFVASLPLAVDRLAAMKDSGRYTPVSQALFAYQLREADGHTVRALVGLVRSDEFSSGPDEPGRIIRNEEVFAEKVTQRRQHVEVLRHLLSAVLLLPAGDARGYDEVLAGVFATLPADPMVTDVDERGVSHSLWRVDDADPRIRTVLDGDVFLVADGNHRSLAAQLSGSPWCLVVLASASGLRIEQYNRLLRLPGLEPGALRDRLTAAGVELVAVPAPADATAPGPVNHLYCPDGWYRMDWPGLEPEADPVARLPHSVVERHVFGAALHLEPFDPAIGYVGGNDQRGYLCAEVDAGRATAALLLRPVTVPEFTGINAVRRQMPRKSTWFMPKARAGLVIAHTGPG